MPSSLLADTYRRYKQDTDDIATWLATTANHFGFSADMLNGNSKNPTQQKSQRLKGKARKQAKQISSNDTSPKDPSPKYTISVKDFIAFAEFLAPKPNVKVPAPVWESLERAIRLRQGHNDYYAQQQAANDQTDDGHAYFLRVLEKVRNVLRPRRQIGPKPPQVRRAPSSDPTNGTEIRLDNIFAALTVEEPSEAFLNIPDIAPATKSDKETTIYMVEPRDDPLELYLAVASMLQDCSKIRHALQHVWWLYSQRDTTLIAAAVTTDVGIRMIQELEEQFMKDHPSESSTVNARRTLFYLQCALQCLSSTETPRYGDSVKSTMFELEEACLLNTNQSVGMFRDALKVNKIPLMEHPLFGVFDPAKDRASMTYKEKVDEDRVLVLEILTDIVFLHETNGNGRLKATDQFTKAVALLESQDRHTMALDFAAQIHLDIHQCLRGQSAVGADDLQTYVKACKKSLKENFKFHADLRFQNWGHEVLDEFVRRMPEALDESLVKDGFGKLQTTTMTGGDTPPKQLPPPRAFFKAHPWLCGSLMFGMKLEMQLLGLRLCQASGSLKFTAQIYHAARQEKLLTKSWEDMDLAMMLHGDSEIFVGNQPKNTDDYFRRYMLSVGYSAQNFSKGGRRNRARPLESNQGSRGQIRPESVIPVAYELRSGYLRTMDESVSDIDKVLAKVLEMNYELNPEFVAGHKRHGKLYSKPEALVMICQSLAHEDLALTFDYFHLHSIAWRLLHGIHMNTVEDLNPIYGPGYITEERELPFVVGFVLMTTVNTEKFALIDRAKKFEIITLDLLEKTSKVIEDIIDSGSGGLEIKTLREKYGMVWSKR